MFYCGKKNAGQGKPHVGCVNIQYDVIHAKAFSTPLCHAKFDVGIEECLYEQQTRPCASQASWSCPTVTPLISTALQQLTRWLYFTALAAALLALAEAAAAASEAAARLHTS